MKRILIFLAIISSLPIAGFAQSETAPFRKISNTAFKRGEELTFRVHYGAVNAGVAIMSIDNSNKLINGRPTMHLIGTGTTKGAFDWVFKVRDRYESYVDEDALMPWLFIRRVDEGGFKIIQNQSFDHTNGKVNSDGKSMEVPKYVQDMLTSFYYARTMDFTKAKKGDTYAVQTFMDNEIWDLKLKFLGKEIVNSDMGKISCMKFCPVVQKGRVFRHDEDLTIWISDDVNHLPIRCQGDILVGSIKLDLIHVGGLAGVMNIVK